VFILIASNGNKVLCLFVEAELSSQDWIKLIFCLESASYCSFGRMKQRGAKSMKCGRE